jgi:hypothetical protein
VHAADANRGPDYWFDAVGSCPAGTVMQSAATWSLGSGATGMVAWGGPGGRSSGVSVAGGGNTLYQAWARCISSYSGKTGPEVNTEAYYGSVPATPSVSASRSSAVIGTSYTINASSNACAANGMGTEWYLGTSSNYLGRSGSSTSITDSRNSPGYYSYTARIRCVDAAGNAGTASDPSYTGVDVYVPAPSNPTYVNVVGGLWSASPGGGYTFMGVQINGGGSLYANGYNYQVNVVDIFGVPSGWGANGCRPQSSSFEVWAQAYGPGGISGWTYSGSRSVASLTRTQQTRGS